MTNTRFIDKLKRKIIVVGHYGSGKTEFSVSLAMLFASAKVQKHSNFNECAIVDLDIINPYFRSREMKEILEQHGVHVFGSAFNAEVTAELPALSANVRAPLENESCRVIIDTGGNDSGALPLNQFSKYFADDTTVLAVLNANRPGTSNIEGAIEHIKAIEQITNLQIAGIVNNTHMMQHTTAADIISGNAFCEKICKLTKKKLYFNCYPKTLINPSEITMLSGNLIPLGLCFHNKHKK
ncbi:MAG: ATP-binding protein [Oscillospiraceae bacterium]|nr:ATP-binding protein [Oscillospiraceae bacterium]